VDLSPLYVEKNSVDLRRKLLEKHSFDIYEPDSSVKASHTVYCKSTCMHIIIELVIHSLSGPLTNVADSIVRTCLISANT